MRYVLLAVLFLLCRQSLAFDFGCSIGTQCIATQNTRVPSKQVIEMMDLCGDFTANDIGNLALKLSVAETLRRTNGKPMHPLNVANYALGKLHESPLKFNRKERAEDTRYLEIKQACYQLERDFNDNSKWTK